MLHRLLRGAFVIGLLVLFATLLGNAATAQQPPPKRYELLDLSTSSDTVNLVRLAALPQVLASVQQRSEPPRKYDYRQARKMERAYNRHRRYYKRLNRKHIRKIRQANLQKARVYERDQEKRTDTEKKW